MTRISLNFTRSTSPTTFYNAWYGEGTGRPLKINPVCTGHEVDIAFCQAKNLWNTQNCSHTHDVGVSCAPTPLGNYHKCVGVTDLF